MKYQIISVLASLFNFYDFLIIAWALLSWVPRQSGKLLDDIYVTVSRLVEPFINIFKRFVPPIGGIDITPIIAILVLHVVERLIISILIQ